jgi:protein-disulfide isomerase
MATPGTNSPGKKDRREEAREKARIAREQEKKRKLRNRIFIQSGIGVAVVAIALVVVLVIVNQPKPVSISKNAAGPLNMISDGIVFSGPDAKAVPTAAIPAKGTPTPTTPTTGKANIVTYIDFQCPYCDQFETTNAQQIKDMVTSGTATLEIHPLANLDNNSQGTRYSTRSANASACVANYDPNNFLAVTAALFAGQPAEGTPGLTDDKLLSILKSGGASSDDITTCVKSQRFATWVGQATARTKNATIPNSTIVTDDRGLGTPTVIVNGKKYDGSLTDPSVFKAFVASVS